MADQIKEMRRLAEKQGWTLQKGGQHWKFIPPIKGRPIVVVSATPSDHRALQNARTDLRRSGLVFP